MIFPKEYKTVGWTREEKNVRPDQKKVYFLSEYILEKTGDGYRLYSIRHDGAGFLREFVDSELLADEEEILLCLKEMNIKNRTLLIETANRMIREENEKRTEEKRKATTVVFKGFDQHLTFVKDPDVSKILEIQIIDVSPPSPPWLFDCVRRLESCDIFGDLQIKFKEKQVDLSVYQSPKTIYPCHSSGLTGKFLDSDFLDEKEDGWLLVGCDTSRRIIETLYPDLKYDFKDMCPMRSNETKPDQPFIMRCCKAENSGKIFEINGQRGVVVHWGAGEWQIAESIRKLAIELQK